MVIDFKNLVDKYDENLLSKLRGFGEEEYLKFWVPDSEKLKSLYNLIDALFESEMLIAEIVNLNLNNDEKKDLEKFKNIAIEKIQENSLKINIDKNKYTEFKKKNKIEISKNIKIKSEKILSTLDDIKYDENINVEYNELSNQFKYFQFNSKKSLNDEKYDNYFLSFTNNLRLDFYIDRENGNLSCAFHNSKKIDNKSVILDCLCAQIINKNIDEVADHGVIYLEHFLRLKLEKKKNFGIFLPRNSGGFFNLIEKKLREARDNFYKKNNLKKKEINKEYKKIPESWTNLNFEKQKERINTILKENIFRQFNISSDDIILNRVIQGNRLEFILSNNLKGDFEDNKLFKIEEILKEKIDSSIELLSIEEKDSNKLRLNNAPKTV